MKTMMTLVACIAALLVAGCKGDKRSLSKGEIKSVWEQVSDKDTIRIRGIGAAPASIKSETQRRGMARNAALVSARYEALALLRGIKLNGGLTIGKLMETDSRIQETADRVISGMEETQVEWASDGGAVVLLEISRDKVEKMLGEASEADANGSPAPLPGLEARNGVGRP